MIDRTYDLPISRQAKALNVSRGAVYYKPRPASPEDLRVMRRIDELHLERPFAGARILPDFLGRGRPPACRNPDEAHGNGGDLSPTEYVETRARPQDLPVSAAGSDGRAAQPGLGDGHQCAAASGVRDGGRSPAIGLQERVANHRVNRRAKVALTQF